MDQLNFTVLTFNFSSLEHLAPPSWKSKALIPVVMLSICFILGVPGNIAIIFLKPNWKKMSCLSQSLMLNLAISDLLCLLSLPPWIYSLLHSWTFSLGTCKLLAGIVYCSVYGSQLTVTAVSVQRYLVVVHGMGSKQVRQGMLLVLLWLGAVILSIPTLVVRQVNSDLKQCKSEYSSDAQRVAVLLTETMLGVAFLSLVAFAYTGLCRKASQGAFFNNQSVTRLVTSIVVCFFILWVPYQAINLLGVAAICLKNDFLLKFCETAWNITGALSFVNSCINPLLYAFTSENVCLKKKANAPGFQMSLNTRYLHNL